MHGGPLSISLVMNSCFCEFSRHYLVDHGLSWAQSADAFKRRCPKHLIIMTTKSCVDTCFSIALPTSQLLAPSSLLLRLQAWYPLHSCAISTLAYKGWDSMRSTIPKIYCGRETIISEKIGRHEVDEWLTPSIGFSLWRQIFLQHCGEMCTHEIVSYYPSWHGPISRT